MVRASKCLKRVLRLLLEKRISGFACCFFFLLFLGLDRIASFLAFSRAKKRSDWCPGVLSSPRKQGYTDSLGYELVLLAA